MGNTTGKLDAASVMQVIQNKNMANPIDTENFAVVEQFICNIINHVIETQQREQAFVLEKIAADQGPDAAVKLAATINQGLQGLSLMKAAIGAYNAEICAMVRKYLLPYYDPRATCLMLDMLQPMMDSILNSAQASALVDEAAGVVGVEPSEYDKPEFDQYKDLSSAYFAPILGNLEAICFVIYTADQMKQERIQAVPDEDEEDSEEEEDDSDEVFENEEEFLELHKTNPQEAFNKYPQFKFLAEFNAIELKSDSQ